MSSVARIRQLLFELGIKPDTGGDIPVYIFPTQQLHHVSIALQKGLWAVADIQSDQRAARATKARQMPLGSNGLFYCSDAKLFTVPFTVASPPEDRDVTDVWPGVWRFPFRIQPLGTLGKRISLATAKREWETLRGVANVTQTLRLSGGMAFVPSWLYETDWQLIISQLADGTNGA